jgi:hypothetical protein
MNYYYFVSYHWSNMSGYGYGDMCFHTLVPINSEIRIKDMRKAVINSFDMPTTITILNFYLLKEEE